uniref:Uncharacterized protein n=1 Tax=Lepeophtheirus salmonis TaxID=72036 RepID=A0A0K2UL78_LEPSM
MPYVFCSQLSIPSSPLICHGYFITYNFLLIPCCLYNIYILSILLFL